MHARFLSAICVLLATATAVPTTQTHRTTTSTPQLSSAIPPGYTYKSSTGSYYRYHHEGWLSWDGADAACRSEGAHLVVLNDAEEADVVAGIVRDATGSHHYVWSGLRDNRPGGVMDWRSVHGEPPKDLYNVWDEGHPKDNAKWTCALFAADTRRLDDAPCDYNYHFICEISQ